MTRTTHIARITGPVPYVGDSGRRRHLPLGACLIERGDDRQVDVVWGSSGQNCAALPLQVMTEAEDKGHLVLLD